MRVDEMNVLSGWIARWVLRYAPTLNERMRRAAEPVQASR